MNKKIVIIGTSCSGKSTLSKKLAMKLKIPHYELDNYFWSNNWIAKPEKEFIELVQDILNNNSNWIICGNYSNVRKALWDKSTDIIWLDYPFYLVFFRAIKRSIIRIYKKEKVCNNNIESFQKTFLSKDSIILWVLKTYFQRKKEYRKLLSQVKEKNIFIIKNQKSTNEFLKTLDWR